MNNAMIDLALGMVLLYAVLSLFVTTLQELVVNALLGSRGSTLRKLVRSAFGEDKALTATFFELPLIRSLSKGSGWLLRRPSYLPPDLVAKGFLAVLGHGEHPARSGLSPQSFLAALRAGEQAPANGGRVVGRTDIGRALSLATTETRDWGVFEQQVAAWIASIGDRSEGWYKRTAQAWTFLIALTLAVLLNVDSVSIARTLWSDAETRTQLADAAVAVNAARQSAASASAPAAPGQAGSAGVARNFAARFQQVEKSLAALESALRDKSFVQEDPLFTFQCPLRQSACATDQPLGQRCALDRRFTPAEAPSCAASDPAATSAVQGDRKTAARKPAAEEEITPAIEWLDDVHALREVLRAARVEATLKGASLERGKALMAAVDTVDRTLAHLIGEMQWLAFKLPDPNARPARTLLTLTRSALDVQGDIAQLYRTPDGQLGRVRAECGLAFTADSDDFRACVIRRDGEVAFHLPMGFAPEVMARQLSDQDLKDCPAGQCGTLDLMRRAALNGALVGWLMTAVALSLGAPFWFDTLGRLVKLRASGTPSKATEGDKKAGAEGRASSAAAPAPAPAAKSGGTVEDAGSGTSDRATPIEAALSTDELKEVQRRLNVPATGVWDERTRAALAERRQHLGMPAGSELDGTLYEAIMERRSLLVEARPMLKLDDQGARVSALRTRLSELLALPSQARGQGERFDVRLRDAVRLFQGRAGLVPDGAVGELTWRALDSAGGEVRADAWMKRAISALGLNEVEHKDQIRAMLAAVHQEAQDPATYAWCACFVAWCLPSQFQATLPDVPTLAASWQAWGEGIDPAADVAYGAVLLLQSLQDTSKHHLAFFVGATPDGWVVLGGNQGDPGEVSVSLFSRDHWRVLRQAMPPAQA